MTQAFGIILVIVAIIVALLNVRRHERRRKVLWERLTALRQLCHEAQDILEIQEAERQCSALYYDCWHSTQMGEIDSARSILETKREALKAHAEAIRLEDTPLHKSDAYNQLHSALNRYPDAGDEDLRLEMFYYAFRKLKENPDMTIGTAILNAMGGFPSTRLPEVLD